VPGDIVLEIDPGMAFGTGIHPTSAECIKMLKTFLKPEDRMLDIGTGSGILMLAGAKLGASKVVGVDSDEVATETARRNLLHNKIDPKKFNILNGNLVEPVKGLYDIVVANILSEVIISLLDHIHKVLDKGGIIIASGIIEKNKKDVIEKMVYNNLDVIKVVIKDGWTTIAARSCIK